ncbi:MAG: DUF433 domain-containing protein [Micrococcales bacterium]|nr:DUF433 domain-containing protein [Micrococcales bacterium]
MPTLSRLDRINVDPAVCHGKPALRETRITVQTVLELLRLLPRALDTGMSQN